MAQIPRARDAIRRQSFRGSERAFVAGPQDVVSPAFSRAAATVGQAQQGLARNLQSVSADFGRQADRKRQEEEQAEEFETQRRFIEFQTQQSQALAEAGNQAQPGAIGFTDNAQSNYQTSAREFFATVPERLKGQYDVELANVESGVVSKAGQFETTARKQFYVDGIETGFVGIRDELSQGIIDYDTARERGAALVAGADIPAADKQKFYDSWVKDAAAASFEAEFRQNPEKAMASLGGPVPETMQQVIAGPAEATQQQRLDYQKSKLFAAMVTQESGGDPDAISHKGATGLMQVLPSTAGDIARAIGDESFPKDGTDKEKQDYLRQPEVSLRYGQYYMNKQLKTFNGDVEAALIAYNAGPGNARKWLKAGRDYAVLPVREETEPYVRNILKNTGASPVPQYNFGQEKTNAGTYRSKNYKWADIRSPRHRGEDVDLGAVSALEDVTDRFGQGALPILSGTPTKDGGETFEIDVSAYADPEKSRLVGLFVSAGAKEVKQPDDNAVRITFEEGVRNSLGGVSGPKPDTGASAWLEDGLNQGLAATGKQFSTTGPVDSKYQVLDYATRQKMIATGRKALEKQRTSQQSATQGAIELQITQDPRALSEEGILANPDLDNATKASLIKKLNTAQEAIETDQEKAIKAQRKEVEANIELRLSVDPLSVNPNDVLNDVNLTPGQKAKLYSKTTDAHKKALGEAYELAIVSDPRSVTEEEIQADVTLSNGKKAALIKQLRTARKEGLTTENALARYRAGEPFNPFNAKERDGANKLWQSFEPDPQAPTYERDVLSFVERTQIAPKSVLSDIRFGLATTDPAAAAQKLSLASQILDTAPQALKSLDGAKDIENAVAEYNRYTQVLGFDEATAIQRIQAARDPEQAATRSLLRKDAAQAAAKYDVNDVADIFDPGIFGFDPTVGAGSPARQAAVVGEYREIFTEHYAETGDTEIAKARTDAQFKKLYGVSDVTGTSQLMRYPPEQTYPAIGGSFDYVSNQLSADINNAFGYEVPLDKVHLIPQAGVTNSDVQQGKAPRYGVLVEREDGVLMPMPGDVFFQADVETAQKEWQLNTMQEFEERQLLGAGLIGPEGQVYVRVLDPMRLLDDAKVIDARTGEVVEKNDQGVFTPTGEEYPLDRIARPIDAAISDQIAEGALTLEQFEAQKIENERSEKRAVERQELERGARVGSGITIR